MKKMIDSEKNKQMNKEALISLGLYLFFFIWWYGFAYGLGLQDIEDYSYIMGMPSWFFFSCIMGYLVISFGTWFVVRKFFVEIPLDEEKSSLNKRDRGGK
ncbi:MAG: YhdT family protein [Clostridia bacterium]|nr:YhdT family protein [Clostridia bacterium]